jgi:membrane dipeptidase
MTETSMAEEIPALAHADADADMGTDGGSDADASVLPQAVSDRPRDPGPGAGTRSAAGPAGSGPHPAAGLDLDPRFDVGLAASGLAPGPKPPNGAAAAGRAPASPVDRARKLLSRHPVVDGHNNLPWMLCGSGRRDPGRVDLAIGEPGLHTDLPRLRAGGVGAQFWAVHASPRLQGDHALSTTLDQIDTVRGLVRAYSETLRLVHTADQIPEARNYGRIAALLGVVGGHCIDNSLGTLRALYALGVRYLALTHDRNTAWADSAADKPAVGGLSPFGEEVVCEMNRLGMLVDLSQSAPCTMRHVFEISKAPVIFSHSAVRVRCDHPANVPDDVLQMLPRNGGVCMVTFAPQYVSQAVADWLRGAQEALRKRGDDGDRSGGGPALADYAAAHPCPVATVGDVADHIEHVRDVAGLDHVALGGDFDGTAQHPAGLEDVSCYPVLLAELLERGWSEADTAKLTWHNPIRVLRGAEFTARSAQRRRVPSTATIERLDGAGPAPD